MSYRIFISSVQREFAKERAEIGKAVAENPFLKNFFSTFIFERDVAATDRRLDEVYISELQKCDLYLALIGNDYGYSDDEGVSATAREYDEATRMGIPRLVFVKGKDDSVRDARELKFLQRISPELVRTRFADSSDMMDAISASLAKFLQERQASFDGVAFEEQEVGDWKDLNEERVRWFLQQARANRGFNLPADASVLDVLTALKMVGEKSGRLKRAAMWCFAKDPQKYGISSGIKCLSWYGKERVKPAASYKWYQGDVFEVADKAFEFVKEKMDFRIEGATTGSSQSHDVFEIDERLVREAINNAVAHRDYSSSASIQVEFYKDRLEVYSPGPLHREMNPALLPTRHESHPNNPILARALYYTKHIEDVGTGITDMFRISAEIGNAAPIYEHDAQHVRVTLMRPVYDEQGRKVAKMELDNDKIEAKVAKNADELAKKLGQTDEKVGQSGSELGQTEEKIGQTDAELGQSIDELLIKQGVRKDLRENMISVLIAIRANPSLGREQLASRLEMKENTVRNAISALKDHKLLRRIGGDYGGHWETISQTLNKNEMNRRQE